MATIDKANTTLKITAGDDPLRISLPIFGNIVIPGIKPTVTKSTQLAVGFDLNSPTIDAFASMRLKGTAGEDVSGWTLGFVQLKYIGTDHARYRGTTPKQGSILITSSNKTLCRDTDEPTGGKSPEVWYDSFSFPGGTTGPNGTNRLAAGTVIPAAGVLDVPAHLHDQPGRLWASVEKNTAAAGFPNNFLRYAVGELLFCTMLVAQEPGGKFHILKHFYWNCIWEHTFKVDGSGNVVPDKAIRLQHNIQRPAHSGSPNDPKFNGKEFDVKLPVSLTVSNKPALKFPAADWRHS
ncbi:MAG TPA: hypothetical protein VL371_15980 [Gemmataceae bacterium]|jgi:hypothetical protein|nr:hypothetical protein [Gemmataceae bacterium]